MLRPIVISIILPTWETGWNRMMPYNEAPNDTTPDSMNNSVQQGNQASHFASGMLLIIDCIYLLIY